MELRTKEKAAVNSKAYIKHLKRAFFKTGDHDPSPVEIKRHIEKKPPYKKRQMDEMRKKAYDNAEKQEWPQILPGLPRKKYMLGEFHTAKNTGERLYKRMIELCKFIDLWLMKNNVQTPTTKDAWTKFINTTEIDDKGNECTQKNTLTKTT